MIEKSDLEGVLKGTLSLNGCTIKVKVSKSTVTLTGRVYSTEQKSEAERIAWKVLGVWTVGNELVIDEGLNPVNSFRTE
ncbi:MAG TPA: BON domain-containing protein [Puia sp.]|jgi:osmotically-inducible protein OsmY|nr:BON domain-containing protein [Puia sp.]